MSPVLRWHVHRDAAGAAAAAAGMIELEATAALAARGRFAIVVTGGTAAQPVYERLARCDTDWSRWHVYFSDERCRPPGHDERNDTMARAAWLDRVSIPPSQIHSIPAELGAEAGAAAYARVLTDAPRFDFTLLGLGEDGHVASVFPRNRGDAQRATDTRDEPRAAETHDAAPDAFGVHDAPKPPPERVTLSLPCLSRSERIAVVAVAYHKRAAVAQMRDGADIPVNRLNPASGIDVFADEAAAGPAPDSVERT